MESERLRYFLALAKTESLRKAAELLNISPSALSKSIHLLQDQLGLELIVPLGRGLTLTDAGRELARRSELILQSLDEMAQDLHDLKQIKKENPIKLGTFEVFSTHFLSVLSEVKWQERGLVLHELIPGALESAVASGQVDYGLTYMPIPFSGCEFIKITKIEMGVYTSKDAFPNITQCDLPFVAPVLPIGATPTRIRGLDGWPEEAYERKIRFQVTLMESALELCRLGKCAGYFPVFVVQRHNLKLNPKYQLERRPSPYGAKKCFSDVYIVKRVGHAEDNDLKLLAKMVRVGCKLV